MAELLKVSDVARRLRVNKDTIYRWIQTGELPAYRVGNLWRIDSQELKQYITSRKGAGQQSGEQSKEAVPAVMRSAPYK